MRHPSVHFALLGSCTCGKGSVDVLDQVAVSNPWLSKSGYLRLPTPRSEFKGRKRSNCTSERMANQGKLVLGVTLNEFFEMRYDMRSCMSPGSHEASMDCAAGAFRHLRLGFSRDKASWVLYDTSEPTIFHVVIVAAWIWLICLGYGREIYDRIGKRIGPSKGEDDARMGGRVVDDEISTTIR